MAETTMTVRLDAEVKAALERLAQSTGQPASRLAGAALARYVALDAWQLEEIAAALAEAEGPEARFVPQAEVEAWVEALAQSEDAPIPEGRPRPRR